MVKRLSCGITFSDDFVANLLHYLLAKEFRKSVSILAGQEYCGNFVIQGGHCFLCHFVYVVLYLIVLDGTETVQVTLLRRTLVSSL